MFNFKDLYILAVLGAILAGAACLAPVPFLIIFLLVSGIPGIEAALGDSEFRENDGDRCPYRETSFS
jgi:hypothetical protein